MYVREAGGLEGEGGEGLVCAGKKKKHTTNLFQSVLNPGKV